MLNSISKSHFRNVTKIAFYRLRNIANVLPFLSQADTSQEVGGTFIWEDWLVVMAGAELGGTVLNTSNTWFPCHSICSVPAIIMSRPPLSSLPVIQRESSMLLLQAGLTTVMLSCLVYPMKPLFNCKTGRMLQRGDWPGPDRESILHRFKVSELAAWDLEQICEK